MAPLPDNNTDTMFVDYQNAVAAHTLAVRTDPAVAYTDLGSRIYAVLNALTPLLVSSTILAVRYRNAGDNFSNPVDAGIAGGIFGDTGATLDNNPVALTFVGRGQSGHRARFSLFGYRGGTSFYRLTTVESTAVATAVGLLNSSPGVFWSIEGTKPTWYNYADIKSSDYWVRRSRGG